MNGNYVERVKKMLNVLICSSLFQNASLFIAVINYLFTQHNFSDVGDHGEVSQA